MDVLYSFLSAPHPVEGVKDALRSCVDRDLVARVEATARTTGKVVLQMAAVRRLAELSTALCPACQRDREVDSAGNLKVHLIKDGDVGAGACPGSRQPAGALAAPPTPKVVEAPAPEPEPATPLESPPAPLPSDPRHARAVRLGVLESVLQRAGWTEVARAAWWATVEGRESFLDGDPGEALVHAGVLKTAPTGADLPDIWRDSLLAWVEKHILVAQAGIDVAVLALCEAIDAAGVADVAALSATVKRAAQLDGPVTDALSRWLARVAPPPEPVAEKGPINRSWEQRVSQMTSAPELIRELDRAYSLLSPRQRDMVDRVKVDPGHWEVLRREVDVSGLGTDPCSRRGKGDTLTAALEDDRPLLLVLLVRAKASAVLHGNPPDTKTIAAIERAHAALMAGERLRIIKPAWTATDIGITCQCGRPVNILRRRDETLAVGLHAGDSGAACRWSLTSHYAEPVQADPNAYPTQCPVPSCRTDVVATWDGEHLKMPRHINPTHLGSCPVVDVPRKHWPEPLVARLNAPVGYAGALGGELQPQACPECRGIDIPARFWRAGEDLVCYAPHGLADGRLCSYVAGPPVREDEMDDGEGSEGEGVLDVEWSEEECADPAPPAEQDAAESVTMAATILGPQPPAEIVELARTIRPDVFKEQYYTRGEVMTFRQAWELGVSEAVALGACVLPGGKALKVGDMPEPAFNFPMDGSEPHANAWVLEMVPANDGSNLARRHRTVRPVSSMTVNIPATITPWQAAAYLARLTSEEQVALVQRIVAEAEAPTIYLSQLGGIDRRRGVPRDRPPCSPDDDIEPWQREWDACDADMRSDAAGSVPFVPLMEEFTPPTDDPFPDELREMLIERDYLVPGDERPLRVALEAALDNPTDEDGVDLSEYRDMVVAIESYLTSAGELGDNEERLTSEVVIDLLRRYSRRHNDMTFEKEAAESALREIGFALGMAARGEHPKAILLEALTRLRQAGKPRPATVVEVGGNPPTVILQMECDVATAQRFGRLLYKGVEVCVDEGDS